MTAYANPTLFGAGVPELDAVREVIGRVIAPAAEHIDRDALFPSQSLQALAEAGLGLVLLPVELGGRNARTSTYAELLAEVAAACGSTSTVYMTQLHCAHPIHLVGSPEQQEWIPRLAAASAIGAIALTEPEAGSDVSAMRTHARRDGDVYVINGNKIFISNGDAADVIVLFATVDPGLGKDGITAFLVETAGLAGFTVGTPMHKLGQRGASTVELTFADCRLPAASVLGQVGQGYDLLLRSVLKSRISAAAQGVGFASGAFGATVRHCQQLGMLSARAREAQDLQFDLAALNAEILAARSMLRAVSDLLDDTQDDPTVEVSMLKLHCTALGVRVAARCVELLGPYGDSRRVGAERRLRDAKIAEIYDGTNQVQSMLVARGIRQAATLF